MVISFSQVFFGKIKVAFVVGAAVNNPCTVVSNHIACHPNRQVAANASIVFYIAAGKTRVLARGWGACFQQWLKRKFLEQQSALHIVSGGKS